MFLCVFFGGWGGATTKKGDTLKKDVGGWLSFCFFLLIDVCLFSFVFCFEFVLKNIFLFVMVYFWRHSDISDIKLETTNIRSHE